MRRNVIDQERGRGRADIERQGERWVPEQALLALVRCKIYFGLQVDVAVEATGGVVIAVFGSVRGRPGCSTLVCREMLVNNSACPELALKTV
jgi:hypothetical protein